VTNAADPSGWRLDPLADECCTYPPAGGLDNFAPERLLGLSVQHYPAASTSVVVVEGSLDLLTAPLLEERVREQLVAAPAHLIIDLESVGFLGSSGLSCLLRARERAQASGVKLHLTGLITRIVARPVELTGLLGVFSTYPTLTHAVAELVDTPDARSERVVPAPVLTAFWRSLMGSVWILELCEFDAGPGPGAVLDWINSGVPTTQPAPDVAQELLAAYGLWLFPDPSASSFPGGRQRIGYASADADVITLAHLVRDDAAQAGLHPMTLAAWVAAGYSTSVAAGWIRAGCLFPR
jgi:anti-sigma B factor antagonist